MFTSSEHFAHYNNQLLVASMQYNKTLVEYSYWMRFIGGSRDSDAAVNLVFDGLELNTGTTVYTSSLFGLGMTSLIINIYRN